jgi:hypothetical protein
MSDAASGQVLPISSEAKGALDDLESQVAGLEAMIAGAKQAKMDTTLMEQTVGALKSAMSALRGIPGAR